MTSCGCVSESLPAIFKQGNSLFVCWPICVCVFIRVATFSDKNVIFHIITARQQSCGKVMFSQMSVSHSARGVCFQ